LRTSVAGIFYSSSNRLISMYLLSVLCMHTVQLLSVRALYSFLPPFRLVDCSGVPLCNSEYSNIVHGDFYVAYLDFKTANTMATLLFTPYSSRLCNSMYQLQYIVVLFGIITVNHTVMGAKQTVTNTQSCCHLAVINEENSQYTA